MKERKNNPKLAVNIIMQEPTDRERNYSPGVLHTNTLVMFRPTGIYYVSVMLRFCLTILRDSLINFKAQKSRENLRREKGAEKGV